MAANALDIVSRELALGPALRARARERERLQGLLGCEGELLELRWHLVHGLRDGSLALDHPGLEGYLRESVVNQVAIDQPRYSGLATALAARSGRDQDAPRERAP